MLKLNENASFSNKKLIVLNYILFNTNDFNQRFGSCSEHLFNSYVLYSMLCGDLEFIKGSTFGTIIQVF